MTTTAPPSAQHLMTSRQEHKPSLLRRRRAVWAVAFACVIAFMGIGLVDPILSRSRPEKETEDVLAGDAA